jgi:peptidoglycan hydrolase-like protein with peptidoglycan-binding domain
MRGRRLAVLVSVALAVSGLGLAACGGGDEEGGATTGFQELLPGTTGIFEEIPEATPEPPPTEVQVIVVKLPKSGKPIGPGVKGAAVARLQKALAALGYDVGEVDGAYGPLLAAAIAEFQKDHDLTADGIAGKATIKAVNQALKEQAG